MPPVPIPLGPQSDPGKSPNAGTALLENCYAEAPTNGKVQFALYSDPGLNLFSAIGGTGSIRGLFALGNLLYTVSGEALYRVTSVGAKTNLGTIIGQKPVIFVANRKAPDPQITIIADTKVYTLEGATLTEMTDPDLPAGVHSAAFLQGRTIYGINDGRFFPSEINDSTDIDALVFGEAEYDSDNGVRVFALGEEFLYFGTRSLEVFRGTGNPDSPFEPQLGAAQGQGSGTLSKHSVVICDNTVFYVNDIGQVVRYSNPVRRISNHAVERDIQAAKDAGLVDEITAFAWAREGHWFYYLCLPGATWAYDAATQLWHKKTSYLNTRSRMKFLANAFDKLIVGDADGTNLYEMTAAAHDENGEYLITAVQSGILADFPAGGTVNAVWVDCEMGLGDGGTDPHSADPQLMMQYTKDGGHTWSSPRMRPLGTQGNYKGRVKYTRLGDFGSPGIAFRFSCSAPIKRAVLQATADITPTAAR